MVNSRLGLLLAGLLLTGCATTASPQPAEPGASTSGESASCEDPAGCPDELRELEAELDELLSPTHADRIGEEGEIFASEPRLGAGSVDCGAARDLRDRICELARTTCARRGGGGGLETRCQDARSICTDARADVARTCD